MELRDLKDKILNNNLTDQLLIILYEDNLFLSTQYLDAICNNKGLTKLYVSSLDELTYTINDIFSSFSNYLYVLDLDCLDKEIKPANLTNCVIRCQKISDELKENYKDYIVEFPKLKEWQVKDYATLKLKGLDERVISWLGEITNWEVYRLSNEIDKISIFPEKERNRIFKEINDDGGYEDLNNFSIFNLTNAIVKRNKEEVKNILENIQFIDVEPVGLITILTKQFKNILSIQYNPRVTYKDLGLTEKQFYAIKNNCNKYNYKETVSIYKSLLSIDYKLKSGLLDNNLIIDYIICNILK